LKLCCRSLVSGGVGWWEAGEWSAVGVELDESVVGDVDALATAIASASCRMG
jgi:hypothetical protein